MRNHDRAVSEVLGYILVFSLVVSSAAIVSTIGVNQLDEVRENEQMSNAERAFDLLAANMDDIANRGAPSRSTEMQLTDGQLDIAEPVEVSFRGIEGPSSPENFSESYDVRPIVYRGQASNSEVVYTGGTLMRTYPETGAVLRDPAIVADDDRINVPLIQTRSREIQSRGGGTARVRAMHSQTVFVASDSDGTYHTVFMNVTSPRADLWADMLNDQEDFSCTLDETGSTDRAVCEAINPDRIFISLVQVDVSLSN